MVDPADILRDVAFTAEIDPRQMVWNEPLGFVQLTEADVAMGSLRLVGFGLPLKPKGGVSTESVVQPVTRFEDLAPQDQTIAAVGKGIGPRMHNTLEAVAGARQRPQGVGVYMFDVDSDKLLDGRQSQGSWVARIARHAGRIVSARQDSVESVVAGIHASYGEADAVLLEVPPLPRIRQWRHGIQNRTTPQFIIVRDPGTTLHRIGSAPEPW